jgi:hypothetical protein
MQTKYTQKTSTATDTTSLFILNLTFLVFFIVFVALLLTSAAAAPTDEKFLLFLSVLLVSPAEFTDAHPPNSSENFTAI